MAIYTTFFLCEPSELAGLFPGWLPPLPRPVRRSVRNFFGQTVLVETREPEWAEDAIAGADRERVVTEIEGDYADYLEGRLPPGLRGRRHWAAKGLTEVELDLLAEAAGVGGGLEPALYGPPGSGGWVQQLPPDLVPNLAAAGKRDLAGIARRWAAAMSTPEHTHSATGAELSGGWAPGYARCILDPLADLARRATPGQWMYLLVEV